jgi:hypothetical protein
MSEISLAIRGTPATRPGTARPGVARPANARAVATNRPRKQVLNGATTEGRRLLDLADAYAQALGGWPTLTELQAATVRRAAELVVLAEMAQRDALTGARDLAPEQISRLESCATRAVRALGLPEAEPERPRPPAGLAAARRRWRDQEAGRG